ncbi:DNA gyrase inhibitor [Bradyrhizobium macuxiense]|uniref:DNA gyrase inhibitor YacG n=1 Tax=Bradyrhizobium macuxiense TaxID=1755647 RepID=A0A120FJ51_9BRAD|nr:DNA gyrase inhibitor YacG [Bradyrhizobium macuxiense]KWV48542.1 DNA gyrase inhibitor [Bradyrhizobium macuxiense]
MDDQARKPPTRTCPICGKPTEQAFRPFCSPRCRDVDLNRWLTGAYVVPGREGDEEDPE